MLISRIQAFIVKVKQAENNLRTHREKEANPLDSKDKENLVVPMKLQYEHNMQNAMQVDAREPQRQEYKCEDDWKIANKVRTFIT